MRDPTFLRDGTMVEIQVFRECYATLHVAIQAEVNSLAYELYSRSLLGTEARNAVGMSSKGPSDRASTVLNDVETKIRTTPPLLHDFLDVLGSSTSLNLKHVADDVRRKLGQAKQRRQSEPVYNPPPESLPPLPSNSTPVYRNCRIINVVVSPDMDVNNLCKTLDQTSLEEPAAAVRDVPLNQVQSLPEVEMGLPHFKQNQEALSCQPVNSTDSKTPENYFTPETSVSSGDTLYPPPKPQRSIDSVTSSDGSSTDEDFFELERTMEKCKQRVKKLKLHIREQKQKMKSMDRHRTKMEEKLTRMEQDLDDATQQKQQLQEEIVSKDLLNTQLQENLRLAQEKSAKQLYCLGQRATEYHAEKIRLTKRCEELESEVKHAQNSDGRVNYYKDYKESERRRKDFERQVERLQGRVEDHEATIANLELEIEILLHPPHLDTVVNKTAAPGQLTLPDSTSQTGQVDSTS